MASRYFPNFPITRKIKDGASLHESALWWCQAAHGGAADLREQFLRRKAEIEQRAADGELGPKGVEKALKALAAEFEPRLQQLGALVDKAKAHHNEVRAKLTAQSAPKPSANADEAVENAFRRHRAISRFESLDPAERREAIRLAIDKRDVGFLSAIVAEPALLNEADARRIEVAIMSGADKALFNEFQELGGRLGPDGQVLAAHESPLAVASYVLDDTKQWLDEQAGGIDASTTLSRAGVATDGPALTLTAEQARDAQLYRAAREVAEQAGKVLSISGDGSAGSITPEGAE